MPGISFFADDQDLPLLLGRLNADPEIAFIVPDGPLDPEEALADRCRASMGEGVGTLYLPFGLVDTGYRQRWKAVRAVEALRDGAYSLWHTPGGPLPLLREGGSEGVIPDPWAGWTEERPVGETPYLGPGHSAEIRLEVWTRYRPYTASERASLPRAMSYWTGDRDLLVVSDFLWIGDEFSDIYGPAPQATQQWCSRLEEWFAHSAVRIDDETLPDAETDEQGTWSFWAFPSALRKLRDGMEYVARGWDLDQGIDAADE
jgi:hypothetical protein